MLGEDISTEELIHIYCSKPFNYHGKVQSEVTIE